jgi:serine/threonine-protein kinase
VIRLQPRFVQAAGRGTIRLSATRAGSPVGIERMKKIDANRFVELVRLSSLVDEQELEHALAECRSRYAGMLPGEPQRIADDLVRQNMLTRWQADKLLEGKHKGFVLGKYRLLDQLGKGGMSSVYLAEHTMIGKLRAIKVLPRKRVEDESYLKSFYLEAKAAATLDHPNIVRAYDVGNLGHTHFLVMEYVKGKDLQTLVDERGAPKFETTADYIAQAATGLAHAHEKGLIHRDIKPANLLVDEQGVVKILDLGLAMFTLGEGEAGETTHGDKIVGTADYLAPEQSRNSSKIDARADIYSLGCTMYFLLTGHATFPSGSAVERIARHRSRMPSDIEKSRPECPGELIGICYKMIQKEPIYRYQSAEQVAEALRRWLSLR